MTPAEQLLEYVTQWDRAMEQNDADLIGSFMHDSWVIVGSDGITSKEAFLHTIRSGDLSHSRMDADETKVNMFGDTAIVISKGTSAGKYKDQEFSFYEWSTSVFIRVQGKWLCIHTMLTPADKGS